MFDDENVHEMTDLDRGADEALEAHQKLIGVESEGWVPTKHYEEATQQVAEGDIGKD